MIVDPIRVLVIDDSPFSRRTLTRILESSPCVRVVGFARDGREALRKTLELQPDLVTLDLEMPRMDGFTFLRLVMAQKPTPVLVVSGRARSQDVFQALELGAVDFVAKPASRATPELEVIREELLRKVHALRDLRIHPTREELVLSPETPSADLGVPGPRRLVVLGASTGGPTALMRILGAFPRAGALPHPGLAAHARGLYRRLCRSHRPLHRVLRGGGALWRSAGARPRVGGSGWAAPGAGELRGGDPGLRRPPPCR